MKILLSVLFLRSFDFMIYVELSKKDLDFYYDDYY